MRGLDGEVFASHLTTDLTIAPTIHQHPTPNTHHPTPITQHPSPFGEVSGGGCGEVMKKHLTIRKADKQWGSALYGEVLSYFLTKTPSVNVALFVEKNSTNIAEGF